MASCEFEGNPPLNSDVGGIGVRVSFYLQTLFLGLLAARAGSIVEISGALYTLMATNTAIALTSLILGNGHDPEISFQDAVIVIYLLSMGWVTVLSSLASCSRFKGETNIMQACSVVQVAVVFRPFAAAKQGRIAGCVIGAIVAALYVIMTLRDYTARVRKWRRKRMEEQETASDARKKPPPTVPKAPRRERPTAHGMNVRANVHQQPEDDIKNDPEVETRHPRNQLTDFSLVGVNILIVFLWSFFVLNTELMVRWSRPAAADTRSPWQFGQVLPMFLAVMPLVKLVGAYREFGLKHIKEVDSKLLFRTVWVAVIWDPHGYTLEEAG